LSESQWERISKEITPELDSAAKHKSSALSKD